MTFEKLRCFLLSSFLLGGSFSQAVAHDIYNGPDLSGPLLNLTPDQGFLSEDLDGARSKCLIDFASELMYQIDPSLSSRSNFVCTEKSEEYESSISKEFVTRSCQWVDADQSKVYLLQMSSMFGTSVSFVQASIGPTPTQRLVYSFSLPDYGSKFRTVIDYDRFGRVKEEIDYRYSVGVSDTRPFGNTDTYIELPKDSFEPEEDSSSESQTDSLFVNPERFASCLYQSLES